MCRGEGEGKIVSSRMGDFRVIYAYSLFYWFNVRTFISIVKQLSKKFISNFAQRSSTA